MHKKKYIFKKNKNFSHIDQLKNFFDIKELSLTIPIDVVEKNKVNKLLNNDFKYIVLFPGGNWKPKIWPANYFNQLMHLLNNKFSNLRFIIVGSLKEKEIYYDNIKKNLSSDTIINLMGESLTTTSAYMSMCNLFIGNDSGLMHLSVASNLKTIALFGPTNDKIYGHYTSNSFVIRTKEKYKDFDRSAIDAKKSYMKSISPEMVLELIISKNLL